MIKLNHLPTKVMDLVMNTARLNEVTADKAVILLLESMLEYEAKRANNDGVKPIKNTRSSS